MTTELFTADDLPDDLWNLIALARKDRDQYREHLKTLDRDVLIQLCRAYQRAAAELYADVFLRHVDPALSEDGRDELCTWVVAQGKEYYGRVLDSPSSMPYRIDRRDPALGFASDMVREYYRRYQEVLPL